MRALAQERVWFLNQLTPGGNIAYNFQFTLWVRGPLRVDVLDRTLTEIVRRHEVLRTRIVLEEALQAGVWKFVYCSTCGVHGNVDNPPANEDAPIQPADYYQRTKYEAEPVVKQLGAALARYLVKFSVLPEPSDRWATTMELEGSAVPGRRPPSRIARRRPICRFACGSDRA